MTWRCFGPCAPLPHGRPAPDGDDLADDRAVHHVSTHMRMASRSSSVNTPDYRVENAHAKTCSAQLSKVLTMSHDVSVAPEQVKQRIQEAYTKAVQNTGMYMSRSSSGFSHLFRDLKLYGRDAGVDFIETHLDEVVREAVAEAECGKSRMTLAAFGFGRSAVDGMASSLRARTALKVEIQGSAVCLIWAEPSPGLL